MSEFIYVLLTFTITVVFCSVRVSPDTYEQALAMCQPNEGLKLLTVSNYGSVAVFCINGAQFDLSGDGEQK